MTMSNDSAESTRPIQLPTCRKCGQEHWAMVGEDDDLCIECVRDALGPVIEIAREAGWEA